MDSDNGIKQSMWEHSLGPAPPLPGRVGVAVAVFTRVAASVVAPGAHGGDGRDVLIRHSLIGTEGASQVVLVVKNPAANVGDIRDRFSPWVGKIPWRRAWQPTPVFLPGESPGQRSLAG